MITGDPLTNLLWLVPMGVFTGAIGTMVGVGGGFIIVPVLMHLYPAVEPGRITSLSLAVIALNSFSGTWAYAKQKRVDFKLGGVYILASIPGVALGSWAVSRISRGSFDLVMGLVLVTLGLFMVTNARPPQQTQKSSVTPEAISNGRRASSSAALNVATLNIASRQRGKIGALIAVFVGFFSTLLGIGGGVIHVPALIYVMKYSPHRATATSQLVLAGMTAIASVIHFVAGDLDGSWFGIGAIGAGMIVGAQFGARWSARLQGSWLLRGLAIVTLVIGGRVLARHLF